MGGISANHVLYMPVVFLIGFYAGALWGRRAAIVDMAREEKDERERAKRREEREARRASKGEN